MPDRIKSLRIESFRGATQPLELKFDSGKPVILIFGENGSGKSTIVDALESVSNGTTTFLNEWKLGKGKRKESYIPTFGKLLENVSLSLEFGDQTYRATLNARGMQRCDTPGRPLIKVLRRKSLQAFIDADPSQRYKEVASFLDIPQIEAAEASLRQAYKEENDNFESSVKATSQAQETLHCLWEAEGSPGLGEKFKTAEAWARNQSNVEIDILENELGDLKNKVKLIESLKASLQSYRQASREFKQTQTGLQKAEDQLAAVESGAAQSNAQLVTLLEDAKKYLKVSPDSLCPVCEETKIEPENLIKRLDQRIAGMDKLKKANDAVKQAQINQDAKSAILQEAKENLLNTAERAQLNFDQNVSEQSSVQKQRIDNSKRAVELSVSLSDVLAARQVELQTQLEKIQKHCHTLISIKQQVSTLDNKDREARQSEKLRDNLAQAVTIFGAKRKAYVETILGDIAEAVDSLYQIIHPNENIGQLKLKLDKSQRGSLVYGVAFGEQQDIQPQPYYSESHLDTLGLCIFLALAKRGEAKRTVVVLDDVLGSVDQQHLKLTLGMLLQVAGGFSQIVITTHYRPLRDQFRYARSPSAPVQLLELKHWNLEQGIRSGKTMLYVDELRQQLEEEDFRRDIIASQAGQLFESLLEFISQTYRCKVPYSIEPRFTFGELASAPNGELKKKLKTIKKISDGETNERELKTIFTKLDEAIRVRNLVGCHFNQWAGELGDQDIIDMAELALELADIMICEFCGGLPVSKKSGSHWECSCKKLQMHPLQQPKKN